MLYPLPTRVFGRVLAADVKDSVTGAVLFKQGHVIYKDTMLKNLKIQLSTASKFARSSHARQNAVYVPSVMDMIFLRVDLSMWVQQ